jgi:hypothetical protein
MESPTTAIVGFAVWFPAGAGCDACSAKASEVARRTYTRLCSSCPGFPVPLRGPGACLRRNYRESVMAEGAAMPLVTVAGVPEYGGE